MTVRILGISGSPRHGNTEIALKEALAGAAEVKDVETELYSIVGKTLNPCTGCFKCGTEEATPEIPCPQWGDDDITKLVRRMRDDFDGFVIGNPVYIGTISAQIKMIFDRAIMMTEGGRLGPVTLRNKVCGVVISSWDRNGGHDLAAIDTWRWAILHDMIVVGVGPERIDCNNYWAGCVVQAYTPNHPDGGKGIWWAKANSLEERTAVKFDTLGLAQCRNTGRRVAELAKVIKAGFDSLSREDTYWPRGGCGGFEGTAWGSK
ncbi:MAG: flavodoxin family protein [Chloroflexi bacterium]|nr:flavodoxin family protein [Chloroflexota bacterium]